MLLKASITKVSSSSSKFLYRQTYAASKGAVQARNPNGGTMTENKDTGEVWELDNWDVEEITKGKDCSELK